MAALEGILEAHGSAMATLARSLLRDPVEAQDVVEEALVRAHDAGPGFRGERGVRTWMLRITANLCRDLLRRRKFTAGSLDGPVPDIPSDKINSGQSFSRTLLEMAQPLPDARHVIFHSYDGYTTNVRLDQFDQPIQRGARTARRNAAQHQAP